VRTSAAPPKDSAPPRRAKHSPWHRLRPFVLLALGGVALYVLLPSLLAVFGSRRSLSHLDWPYAVLVLLAEVASFVCLWELDRIALRTRAWLPVIAAQLSGNAAGRVFPGGGATATVVAASMLRQAGIETGEAAAAFSTSTLLQLATTFALPILALPAIVGGAPINHSLATAAYLGAVVFVLLLAAGSLILGTDRPLELVGQCSAVAAESYGAAAPTNHGLAATTARRTRLRPDDPRPGLVEGAARRRRQHGLRLPRPAGGAAGGRCRPAAVARAPGVHGR
jgi:hypothetical protein